MHFPRPELSGSHDGTLMPMPMLLALGAAPRHMAFLNAGHGKQSGSAQNLRSPSGDSEGRFAYPGKSDGFHRTVESPGYLLGAVSRFGQQGMSGRLSFSGDLTIIGLREP